MGLIIDTGVLIAPERLGTKARLERYGASETCWISAISCSELLVGVHLADNERRRERRSAYVESILARLPVLDFTGTTARIHARLHAEMRGKGHVIGAHDLMIAATAVEHGYGVLTLNLADFERVPGLKVLRWTP